MYIYAKLSFTRKQLIFSHNLWFYKQIFVLYAYFIDKFMHNRLFLFLMAVIN